MDEPQPRSLTQPPRRLLIIGAAAALITGAVAGALAIRAGRADAAEPVTVVRWSDRGEGPFWETAASPDLGAIHANVGEVARSASGPVTGTAPGLYGGSRRQLCDVTQLKQLAANGAGRAAAFAAEARTPLDQLGPWLDGLTPVVLSADTWLTGHGFAEEGAAPLQVVLQAGTAVLVDRTGQPRVRCNGAIPLSPPQSGGITLAATRGPVWDGYDAARVLTIQPGTPVDALDLVDVSTGERYRRTVGAGAGWVAVANGEPAPGGPRRGQVLASPDGGAWEAVLGVDEGLTAVAYGDGRWLAAGTTNVYSSDDRRSWRIVSAAPGAVADLAYGDGRWVAVGARDDDGVIWESRDGWTWSTVAELPGAGAALESVGFGNGRWVVSERSTFGVAARTSTDTRSWDRIPIPDTTARHLRAGFGGGQWVLIGAPADPAGRGTSAISTDGRIWTTSPLEPAAASFAAVVYTGERWFAVGAGATPTPMAPILLSNDAVRWLPVGELPLTGPDGGPGGAVVADLAYGGGPVPGSGRATGAPAADDPAPPAPTTARVGAEVVSRRAAPVTTAAVIATLSPGTKIRIECQLLGERVGPDGGSPVWNRLVGGGYVADAYTDTPKAPEGINPAIGTCPP